MTNESMVSGISGTVKWEIDKDGTLTLSPLDGVSGTMESMNGDVFGSPWHEYRHKIKKAIAKSSVALAQDISWLFFDCQNLKTVELNNLDTSRTQYMEGVFWGCKSLTSLDGISDWKTGNVLSMRQMLKNCESLTSLSGLAKWETDNLNDMSHMLSGCSKVTSVDFSKWRLPTVKGGQRFLLHGCSSLSEITISGCIDFRDPELPAPQANDVYTGNWTYGDPYNHNPEDVLTNTQFCTGTHKAGTWYWERKGTKA